MSLPRYDDITSRIADRPLWWIEGVPRYEPFTPHAAEIFSNEIALVHTECQFCRLRFDVCVQRSKGGGRRSFEDYLAVFGTLDVGDPPNVGCCSTGYSMTSLEIAILQLWQRSGVSWVRVPEHELLLDDAEHAEAGQRTAPAPAVRLLNHAGLRDQFDSARKAGNRNLQLALLKQAGCSRAEGVMNFWQEREERASFAMKIANLRND